MPAQRIQFTIKSLMIAVLIVACSLALFQKGPECVLVIVLLGIPLAGSSKLMGKVPPRRTSWRFGISAVMLGLIILGGGLVLGSLGTVVLPKAGTFHLARRNRSYRILPIPESRNFRPP